MTESGGNASGAFPSSGDADNKIRRRFLRAASTALEGEGFEKFNIRTVCQLAGLSTHAFYAEFTGKEDLLAALLELQYESAGEHLRRNVDPSLPPVEYVRSYVSTMIRYGLEILLNRPFSLPARRIRALLPDNNQLAERAVVSALSGLITALEEGHRRGELNSTDPRSDALAIYHLCTSSLLDQPHTGPIDRQEYERTLVSLVDRALGIDER